MSTTPAGHRSAPSRRSTARNVTVVVVLLLVACVAWLGVRAVLAKGHLDKAVSLASSVQQEVTSGDAAGAQSSAKKLATETHSARNLTSDPIWRGAEILPLVGHSMKAVRQVSAGLADITDNAIVPIAGVLGDVDISKFKPTNGAVDLAPLVKAQPAISAASQDLSTQLRAAHSIDTTDTISQVESAVQQYVSVLTKADSAAGAADKAVRLLPSMLGTSGARNYLLLFQNNAEVRSTGGIPGAVALVAVDKGKISLAKQASSADFPKQAKPVLPLPIETEGIYGSITGEYMQDVNLTPKFDLTGQLAREMWKKQYGTSVNGVISIDPVALSYILSATGPVTLPTGGTLTSSNAVSTLLSDSYARYPVPAEQDAFFAGAASAVFSKVASGDFEPKAFISALSKSADQHRILVWSTDASEQKTIATTSLAGSLPEGTPARPAFGAYFSDSTGAKMDYYLKSEVGVGQKICRKDGRPTWVVDVTVSNTAPQNAGTTLPSYVTGGADFGVTPGNIQTTVSLYAPKKAVFAAVTKDGKTVPVHTAADSGHSVTQFEAELAPGKSTTYRLEFVGPSAASKSPVVEKTPLLNDTVAKPVTFRCEAPLG